MGRMGKKTLYLDLDLIDRLDAVLKEIPVTHRPSVSSLINSALPGLTTMMEEMLEAAKAKDIDRFISILAAISLEANSELSTVYSDMKQLKDQKGVVPPKESE